MAQTTRTPAIDLHALRELIQDEFALVAAEQPGRKMAWRRAPSALNREPLINGKA
jgi:hypothetical protein